MALPQRRDPYEREREIRQEMNNRELDRDTRANWFSWWWLWLLLIVLIFAFAGWGWGGYGGWWGWGGTRAVVAQPANNNVQVGGQGAPVLEASNRAAYAGQDVSLQHVKVTNVLNDSTVWVGGGNVTPMLVVLPGANNTIANASVSEGDWVNVRGVMQKAPPPNGVNQGWNLSKDGVQQLEQQGAYLQANQLIKQQNNQ